MLSSTRTILRKSTQSPKQAEMISSLMTNNSNAEISKVFRIVAIQSRSTYDGGTETINNVTLEPNSLSKLII